MTRPQGNKAGQAGSLFAGLEAAGTPSGAGPTTTAPTGRPSPPGDPAADDQPGPLAEATGQAQQEGDAAHAGQRTAGHAGGCPAGPEPADRPAATTPAAPEPGRPGAGEAPTTEAQADHSGAGQAAGRRALSGSVTSGDGDETPKIPGKIEVSSPSPVSPPRKHNPCAPPEGDPRTRQADGQADAQAASGGDLHAQRLWLRAVDELAGELPPAVLEGLRDATARWGGTKPPGPRSYELRCRCGSAAWNLTVLLRPPHYGHAVRCVCGRCRKVLGLLWWEGGPGNLADDPPQRGELAADS